MTDPIILTTLRHIANSDTPIPTMEAECRRWGVQPVKVGGSIMMWQTFQRLARAMVNRAGSASISTQKGVTRRF